ncbi:MAG: hypothetical protein J6Y02_02170 [Pseudobutyrivibrio sp.]|nr:hypothetical protein [Pseudobutyrivibrio sp.]
MEDILKEAIERKDFGTMYSIFEHKYNPYPVQMARSEAFGKARDEGLISEAIFRHAREYYGSLWNYVGD